MISPEELEKHLRARHPTAYLDRDRILFEAGRRSARRPLFWPLATLATSALAITLGLQLASMASGPSPGPEGQTQPPQEVVPAPTWQPVAWPMPAVRDWESRVLEQGLEGLGPLEPLPPASNWDLGDGR